MKTDLHPQWYPQAQVSCACGHTFTVGATKAQIQVEICSHCHPFFTGEMKFVDTLGRVERFQQKQQKVKAAPYVSKKAKKAQKKEREDRTPKSLKEMLMGLK